jgi:amino acid transporter
MWNYMGFDNASNVGGEVENPQRTYPLAMVVSVALITLGYIVPIGAMARIGIAPAAWTTGSWATLGGEIAGRWIEIAIVLGGMIAALATFNSLTMSYSRLPMVMARDGLLPKVLSRVTAKTGAPWVSILACAVLWGACLGLGFERLVTLDVVLWGASMVLEFLALVLLRLREPDLRRPFRIPGGIAACALLGVPPTALVVLAAVHGQHETVAGLNAMLFGALIVLAGFLAYAALRRPSPETSAASAVKRTL